MSDFKDLTVLPITRDVLEIRVSAVVAMLLLLLVAYQNGLFVRQIASMKEVFDSWRYLLHGADMVDEKYSKAKGAAFKMRGPDNSFVFVSSKLHIREMVSAKRDELSLFAATKQMFEPAYTMSGHNWLDERGAEGIGYVKALATLLPNQIPKIVPEMLSNVSQTFDAVYAEHKLVDGGKNIPAYVLAKKLVCRLNGFSFFGNELANNELFMETVYEYNELVLYGAEVLRLMPTFMKKIVGPYFKRRHGVQDIIFGMINDIVDRRMEDKACRENGADAAPPMNDLIQWTIDTAPKNAHWTSRRVTYEIIAIWFGSVHGLSATVTYALYDLCQHKEYLEPLRAEMQSVEFEKLSRTSQGMPLLDSFIKESTRLSPMEAMTARRQALRDFTFSDGTTVKKDEWACIPERAILHDDAHFPDAANFHGFRFASPDKIPGTALAGVTQPEGPSRFVDVSAHYHNWGIGSIVCPGRFYASIAVKLVLKHLLDNYDLDLVDPAADRTSVWRTYLLPKESTLVKFTPRTKRSA